MSAESPFDRRWKFPAVPFLIGEAPEPIADDILRCLSELYVPDISDVVGRMYTMSGIKPFFTPIAPVVGLALTVKCPPGDNLALKKALTLVRPGNVIVVDAQGFTEWCLGGFQMLKLAIRDSGLKGLIVNGGYRDESEAKSAGFPIYAKAHATWSGPKIGPGEINVPVCCGGVIVHPGDVVCAGGDGIVVVPRKYAFQIAEYLTNIRKSATGDAYAGLAAQNASMNVYLDEMASTGRLVKLGPNL